MATWRREHVDGCPLDGESASYTKCGDCPYFRGLSSGRGVLCNWPRNGSFIDDRPDMSDRLLNLDWLKDKWK